MKAWEWQRLAEGHEALAAELEDKGRLAEAEYHRLEAHWARECAESKINQERR